MGREQPPSGPALPAPDAAHPHALASAGSDAAAVGELVVVRPKESLAILKNPGRGWMTMFGPEVLGANTPPEIPSSLSYVRLMWSDLHRGDERYDWSTLDQQIALARKGGQQVMVRVMPVYEQRGNIEWMRQEGLKGYGFCAEGRCGLWVPDLDDPRVRSQVDKFITAFGARYDGHPDVDSIEISLLGIYGEGHFANTEPKVPMPSAATQQWLADLHYRHFARTPIIGPIAWDAPITDYMVRTYGSTRGAGVFLDCWGEYPKGNRWAHMTSAYPPALARKPRAWERGIVKLEPCGTMANWPEDVARALDWAIENHASYIGNKNAPVPASAVPLIQDRIRKIGYRFVVRKLEHPPRASAGRGLALRLDFDNVGNAPAYHDYVWAVRLAAPGGATVHQSSASVRHLVPGSHSIRLDVPVPDSLPRGRYGLSIGLVRPGDPRPAVHLAIDGRDEEGWYPLSAITVD